MSCDKCFNGWLYKYKLPQSSEFQELSQHDISKYATSELDMCVYRCSCNSDESRQKKILELVLPSLYSQSSFSSYNTSLSFISQSQKYVYESLRGMSNEEYIKGGLIIGDSGVGKTHLLTSLCVKQELPFYLCTENELIVKIKGNEEYKSESLNIVLQKLFHDYKVIVIRRLGTLTAKWDRDLVAEIIISLYECEKWTVWGTTWYHIEQRENFQTLEDRINNGTIYHSGTYSKLRSLCKHEFILEGIDYREYQRTKGY